MRLSNKAGRLSIGLAVLGIAWVSATGANRDGSPQVYYTTHGRIKGFDPVRTGDAASIHAMALVYEGLLQYHYLDRPYRLTPLLAERMPAFSEDGLTLRIRLRDGIRFLDDSCFPDGRGREVRADDFVYSIKRLADLKNEGSGYWIFRGRIKGLDAFREASANPSPTDYHAEIEGLRAVGPLEIEIRLTEPYPQLLWVLAMHYTFIVPREAVAYYGERFQNHPVGTGPYRLTEWTRNYRRIYDIHPQWASGERNDTFPRAPESPVYPEEVTSAAGQPLPGIQRVVHWIVGDPSTEWLLFLQGQLNHSGIHRDNWNAVVTADGHLHPRLAAQGFQMTARPSLDMDYIGFNMDDPVVGQNRDLRRAMSCAFDHEAWVQYHQHRVAAPTGPVPAPLAGHLEGSLPYGGGDLDRAREWLVSAGYPGGIDPETGRALRLTLELAAADNAELRQSTELFIDFMRRIGLDVRPSYNNRPVFFEKVSRREAQMFRLSWIADYPDAQNFLQLFYSGHASPGSNRANYADPVFDRWYERARALPAGPERTALYRKMAKKITQDCPWIFLHQPMRYDLYRKRLKRFVPHVFPYGMVKYLALEPEGQP